MIELELIRNNYLIDPVPHFWGWEVPVDLFLGGTTAGLMILTAVLALRKDSGGRSGYVRWMPFAAPMMIAAALFCLMLDLSHKPHLYRFYLTFQFSAPMSWGSWILLAVFPLSILFGLAGLKDAQAEQLARFWPVRTLRLAGLIHWFRKGAKPWARQLAWGNLLIGLALGIYTGVLLSSLGVARPAWNSALMGPLFLASGLTTGAALVLLFPVSDAERSRLRRWNLWAIASVLGLLGLLLIGLLTDGQVGRQVLGQYFGGPHTALFWALVVIAGLVVPLVLNALEHLKGLRALPVTSALLFAGALSMRWIFVLAGQT